MFGYNVKIDSRLLKQCRECAVRLGYSSAEEFIRHVLERECRSLEEDNPQREEEITQRLKGLGYIE